MQTVGIKVSNKICPFEQVGILLFRNYNKRNNRHVLV